MSKYSDKNLYPLGLKSGDTVDWSKLTEVDFAVLEAGELKYWDEDIHNAINPNLAANVDACYKAGKPVVMNWKHNPQYYADCSAVNPEKLSENFPINKDKQILALIKACENKTYHAIMVDCQRYWIDQDKHDRGVEAGFIPPSVIIFTTRYFISSIKRAMQLGKLRTVPILLYSASWYIDTYSKDLVLGSLYDVTAGMDTSEAKFSTFTGDHEWGKVREDFVPPDTAKPTGINGLIKLWHYAGILATLPIGEKRVKVDLFLSMLKKTALFDYLKFVPNEPNEPSEEPGEEPVTPPVDAGTSAAMLVEMKSTNDLLRSFQEIVGLLSGNVLDMLADISAIRSKFS
jgi:hypothetical protein